MDKKEASENTWSVDIEGTKELLEKQKAQKTFKFYKDENLPEDLYLIPYSVCMRPSEDNMSLLSLYKSLVWCGYASENYWNWCKDAKEVKEVSFYEYIDALIKAIQVQTCKETTEKFAERFKDYLCDKSILEFDSDDSYIITASLDECYGKIDKICKEIIKENV